MSLIDKIRNTIDEEMQLFGKTFAESLYTDNPLLLSVNDYVLQKSGKQLRPMVTILSAKLGGKVNQSTIDAALSLEFLHSASLIHDDVVDDVHEHRGKPSVNARWTNKIAILSGDYILSKSLVSANRTDSLPILKAIAQIGMQLSDGELLKLENNRFFENSESNYFNIIRKKTAFLFATCAEVGGLSVGADDETLQYLRNFGEYLGICFQLKDDIIDYRADISEGKVTLPLIYAVMNSTGAAKDLVLNWLLTNDFSTENTEKITQFVIQNGGLEHAVQQMNIYKIKAIEELKGFADSDIKQSLIMCAEYAANREY